MPEKAEVILYDPQSELPSLEGFDALLVQTVTKLYPRTVPTVPSRLTFIGTASSGSDHINIPYFQDHGIKVADAKGCNANTVAEYVMTAILLWKEKHQPERKIGKVGVIGAGKTGCAVIRLLERFELEYVAFDPPRAMQDQGFMSASLDEVLSCEILTFHVPLTNSGDHKTYHWLDEQKLSGRNFDLIINAARGGVIDETAMMKAHAESRVRCFILDVWENEPDFNEEVAQKAFISTPHIAGYSEQSKTNATQIVCQKLADHFHFQPTNIKPINEYKIIPDTSFSSLSDVLTSLHPILEYAADLREIYHHPDKQALFKKMRHSRPYRYEYPTIKIDRVSLNSFLELQLLGVKEK